MHEHDKGADAVGEREHGLVGDGLLLVKRNLGKEASENLAGGGVIQIAAARPLGM